MSTKSNSVSKWLKFRSLNWYYHEEMIRSLKFLIPADASIIEFGARGGEVLERLANRNKVGVVDDNDLLALAHRKNPRAIFYHSNEAFQKLKGKKFDYIILSQTLTNTRDIQQFINYLKKVSHSDTRIIVLYFNFLWKPLLNLGEKIGLKLPEQEEPNWLTEFDIENFFVLESFEKIKTGQRFIIPYNLPVIALFVNRFLSQLPIFKNFALVNYSVFRLRPTAKKYSVSIVIPARNEEGNMRGILRKIPKLSSKTEVIFVEGHSKDKTYSVIKEEIKEYHGPFEVSLYKQKGIGKGDAIRLGFSKSKNEVLMILDADLTVEPKELTKFYFACSQGLGDLVMGTRLVYPMEKLAMRTLNYIGNKFFGIAFTFLLDQKIRDTLCGTKVLLRHNYLKIEKNREIFGDFDPFGDFDLIFGAAKLNLKIMEIPIRYRERTYGETNISRFKHGLLLLRMVWFAAWNLKFV